MLQRPASNYQTLISSRLFLVREWPLKLTHLCYSRKIQSGRFEKKESLWKKEHVEIPGVSLKRSGISWGDQEKIV